MFHKTPVLKESQAFERNDLMYHALLSNAQHKIDVYDKLLINILTIYAPAKSSEKQLTTVRVTSLCKGNVCGGLAEGPVQDGLQQTMWSYLYGDGIGWDKLRSFLKQNCT